MIVSHSVCRDRDDLALHLAQHVAGRLRAAIRKTGTVTLAVPGGSTPAGFLCALGAMALDWGKVTVTLTDERWVPAGDPRSNQGMVAGTLLAGKASAARFVPLYCEGMDRASAMDVLSVRLAAVLRRLDVCVLGMGDDMHTASLFPGATGTADALRPDCGFLVMPVDPPDGGVPRITLTAPVFHAAGDVHLLIHGTAKQEALDRACATVAVPDAPIKCILDGPAPVTVWSAP